MSEHTPLPWEVKDDHMVVEPMWMEYVADCALNHADEEDKPDRWRANAEYIVRAANLFPELVGMLDRMNRFMGGDTEGDDMIKEWIELHIAVYELMQKARGEQP